MGSDDKHAVLHLVEIIVSGGFQRTGFNRYFIEAEEMITAVERMKEYPLHNKDADLKIVIESLGALLRIARGL